MAGIIRHEGLKPLSRHHHHALMAALKIRKAFEAGEVEDQQLKQLQRETIEFWDHGGGNAHFREEEEILIPAYAKYASIEQPEIIELLLDHVRIRSFIDRIRKGDELETNLKKLSETLEPHVRQEERVIFPMIEKALPNDVLLELQPYFHEHHKQE